MTQATLDRSTAVRQPVASPRFIPTTSRWDGGDAGSLKALKEGEEHGLKDYTEGFDDIDATSGELVQNQLIPAQQRHINLLDQLIASVGKA